MKLLLAIAAIAACMVLAPTAVDATLYLPAVISSNMVLQRGTESIIWGWTDQPLSPLTISLTTASGGWGASTYANINGSWIYNLAEGSSIAAGTGYNISLSDANSKIVLTNIAFGDVILCSGQSNMEMTVEGAYNASQEIADSINYPNLRMFSVAKVASYSPLFDETSKDPRFNWTVSGPNAFDTSDSWQVFSATCYFTGRDLYKALGGLVPIGLVASDWGGTPVEAWSSPLALSKCPSSKTVTERSIWKDEHVDEVPVATLDSSDPTPPPDQYNNSALWNAMINPLLPMRFNLAVWYQGEANAGDPKSYACRFPAMISDWRAQFGLPLPFFFVQLAAFPEGGADWPIQQVAQTAALVLPLTGMATAMDLGDPTSPNGSIHPRDKQTVGARLVLSILNVVYGETTTVASGPVPLSVIGVGVQPYRAITLSFAALPTATDLVFEGTENCGYNMTGGCCQQNPFEIQTSPSMNWTRANVADIEGLSITIGVPVLTNNDTSVVGMRYAFQSYAQCALYNFAHLPMTPFSVPVLADEKRHHIVLTEQ